MTAPPCLLVVGMARSGTSAVTELLSTLDLSLPRREDLMPGDTWNEHGYFESIRLTEWNEALLDALGGSLTAPPELPAGWEAAPDVAARYDEARALFDSTFPSGQPVVWKDPRLSLLLPFWREVLTERPVAAVLIWRTPDEVARSLRVNLAGVMGAYHQEAAPEGVMARSLRTHGVSMTTEHGLALWERYNRAALSGLAGLPVLATSYDHLLRDPAAVAHQARHWLGGLYPEVSLSPPQPGTVTPALHHVATEEPADLPASRELLVRTLAQLEGTHRSFAPPDLPPLFGWSDRLLAVKRDEEREVVRRAVAAAPPEHRAAAGT